MKFTIFLTVSSEGVMPYQNRHPWTCPRLTLPWLFECRQGRATFMQLCGDRRFRGLAHCSCDHGQGRAMLEWLPPPQFTDRAAGIDPEVVVRGQRSQLR